MTLKLNSNHQVVWRDPNTMQIGLDHRKVVLSEVSAGQEKFIDALYFGLAPNQLEAVARQSKLPLEQAQDLVTQLDGLLERDVNPVRKAGPAAGQPNPGPINVDSAFAEIVRASLRHSSNGRAVLLERGRRAVHIDVLDGTGVLLAQALVAAGVGTIVSHDPQVVTQFDVGANAYPQGLIGHARIDALRLMLEAGAPGCRVVAGGKLRQAQLDAVDAAVVVGQQVIEPKRYGRWLNRGVSHLGIRYEANFVEVSPLIVAGVTPCLHCQQLWIQEADAQWAVMSSQLQTSEVRFDAGTNRLFACGLAAQTLLAGLDAVAGFSIEQHEVTGFRLDHRLRTISPLTWESHPSCTCSLVGLQQLQKA